MDSLRGAGFNNLNGASGVSYKQFIDRLQYARPTDLTRQQESSAEPETADHLDVRFERGPVQAPPPPPPATESETTTQTPRETLTREQPRNESSQGTSLLWNQGGLFSPNSAVPHSLLDAAPRYPTPQAQDKPLDYRTLIEPQGVRQPDGAASPQRDGSAWSSFVQPSGGGTSTGTKWALGLGLGAMALSAMSPFSMMPFGMGMGFPMGNPMFSPMMTMMPMLAATSSALMMAQMFAMSRQASMPAMMPSPMPQPMAMPQMPPSAQPYPGPGAPTYPMQQGPGAMPGYTGGVTRMAMNMMGGDAPTQTPFGSVPTSPATASPTAKYTPGAAAFAKNMMGVEVPPSQVLPTIPPGAKYTPGAAAFAKNMMGVDIPPSQVLPTIPPGAKYTPGAAAFAKNMMGVDIPPSQIVGNGGQTSNGATTASASAAGKDPQADAPTMPRPEYWVQARRDDPRIASIAYPSNEPVNEGPTTTRSAATDTPGAAARAPGAAPAPPASAQNASRSAIRPPAATTPAPSAVSSRPMGVSAVRPPAATSPAPSAVSPQPTGASAVRPPSTPISTTGTSATSSPAPASNDSNDVVRKTSVGAAGAAAAAASSAEPPAVVPAASPAPAASSIGTDAPKAGAPAPSTDVLDDTPLGPDRLDRNTPRLAPLKPYELTPGQQAARDKLSPERRQMFDELFDKFQGQKLSFPRLGTYSALAEDLSDLLQNGTLDKKDKNGVDILTNLSQMSRKAKVGYIKPDELTAQAIASIRTPSAVIRQGDHGTCAATTVQYMLARRNPAEYVRIAAGLCSDKGEVTMPNGEICRRIEDSTREDKSGRMPLERVMQSAFMNFAAAKSNVGEYSNSRDGFRKGDHAEQAEKTVGGADDKVRSGLWMNETARLTEAAMNEKYAVLLEEGKDSTAAVAQMQKIFEKTPDAFIPASLQWGDGRHRVVVTGIKDGRVEFRNPWGDREDKPGTFKLDGVDHQVMRSGFETMPLSAFTDRVKHMIVPERLTAGLQA